MRTTLSAQFVIDRNDGCEYYYVEKFFDKKKKVGHYHIYDDDLKPIIYNDHNFHAIFNTDQKISVFKFCKGASLDLIGEATVDEEKKKAYDTFNEVLSLAAASNDRKKVNLGSLKNDFIKSIKIYNAALAEFERIEIPIDDNYYSSLGLDKVKSEREKAIKISNLKNRRVVEKENLKAIDQPIKSLVLVRK